MIMAVLAAMVILAMPQQAYAAVSYSSYDSPTNGSTVYSELTDYTMNVTITISERVNTSCQMMWADNQTLFDMTSLDTAVNTSWNYSWVTPAASRNGDWQNMRFKCGNTTALKVWSNATLLYYKLKDADYTILDRVIANNSIFSYIPALNITIVSDSATNCTFDINATGAQSSLMAQSPNRGFWSNYSENVWADTAFGESHNITYNCTDSAGNYSSSASHIYFKIDTVIPIFSAPAFGSIGNYSTSGNIIPVWFNITDENPSHCGLSLFYGSGNRRNISSEVSYSIAANTYNCSINVTPSDIVEDGYVEVTPLTRDAAGNENTTANQSYIIYRLKTGWNTVTFYENKTLAQIAGMFPNVVYISVFDNRDNMKNFSTYTVGGSTNSGLISNLSSNYGYGAVYVYVSADTVIMSRYYAPPTAWLTLNLSSNSTSGKTAWNLVGVTKQLTDLNATVMKDACSNFSTTTTNETVNFTANNTWIAPANTKMISVSSIKNMTFSLGLGNFTYNATHIKLYDLAGLIDPLLYYNMTYTWTVNYAHSYCGNITWTAWYDTQNAKSCGFYRNRLSTGCAYTSAQWNLTRGDGLWMAVSNNLNISLARGSW